MTVQLHLTSTSWNEAANGIKQRGTYWQSPVQLLEATTNIEISKLLQQQNGFYALIWEQGSQLYAAVDHIRSIPLFYALEGHDFYLSDDAEWVREQVGNATMDEIAKQEFQLTGYVTGQDTLYPDVKQLQAGEFLSVTIIEGIPQLKTERYYRFLHTEPEDYNEQALYQQLDVAALASIDNLIHYANGRQIVIPLSGGYDSRLIATLLKRRGYQNILTFTYGVPGNKESAYSKKVADTLGLQWHFVEYSDERWHKVWQTEERWQYQKWASGWSSTAHLQDFLAVKVLQKNSIIDDNCVFVPGHTGDFVAGGHIPGVAFTEGTLTLGDSIIATLHRHYSLVPRNEFKIDDSFLLRRIKKNMEFECFSSNLKFADSFEKWDWQERQAKFICNSVRVYEFYGYDWWMPLWDMNFVRFWQAAPLELRKHKRWYLQYVSKVFATYQGGDKVFLNNASDDSLFKKKIKESALSRFDWLRLFVKVVSNFSRKYAPLKHPLSLYGRYQDNEYQSLIKKGYSINGLNAYSIIRNAEHHEKITKPS